MSLAGVGVDLVNIERMAKVLERRPNFATRVFTDDEIAYCTRQARPAESFAARFAAREAVLKALGIGFADGVGLKDVSVAHDDKGKPYPILQGRVQEIAREQGIIEIALSLTHTRELAVANVVAMTEESRPQEHKELDAKQEFARNFREARTILDELDQAQSLGLMESEG